MANPIQDSLLREIDEDLRHERYAKLWKKYGAFVIAAAVCFVFMMSGLEMVLSAFKSWAPPFVVDVISSLSFLSHFDGIIKGVIDLRDLIYLLSAMLVFLFANVVVIDMKKGG